MAKKNALPGFGLSLGVSVTLLTALVLLPLAALLLKSLHLSAAEWQALLQSERLQQALWVSFSTAAAAGVLSVLIGGLLAWVLVRYPFPGRRGVDALIDLPFALPTAVAGIALTALYSKDGWVGRWLEPLGLQVAYTTTGITLALLFIGLPFVVRTVQPVLGAVEAELEQAAATLGASRTQTVWRVIFPLVAPALLTGFALAFARGIGEYGSVIFIAGNMPYQTEIAPLLIVSSLEEYNYAAATAIAVIMLAVSFVLLLTINVLQRRLLQAQRGQEV
jgi:sulfate transport system permease protein